MRVSRMEYECGITIDVKGTYFKETYREVVELDENDDPEKVRQELKDRVHDTIDSEIEEIRRVNK